MTSQKIKSIYLLLLLAFFYSGNAQQALPTIACICELEALIIQSEETDKELILEETEDGFTYKFIPKEIEIPKQEKQLIDIEDEAIDDNISDRENDTSVTKSQLRKRKAKHKKKRKAKKVRLKKKKYKKYKGDCPKW